MDLTVLTQNYTVFVIVGICLCIGYMIKDLIPDNTWNKYIPLTVGVIGILLNIWISGKVTPDVVLAGMWSGLASTGLHEFFKNMIKGDINEKGN